jgi:hypothetical protein
MPHDFSIGVVLFRFSCTHPAVFGNLRLQGGLGEYSYLVPGFAVTGMYRKLVISTTTVPCGLIDVSARRSKRFRNCLCRGYTQKDLFSCFVYRQALHSPRRARSSCA